MWKWKRLCKDKIVDDYLIDLIDDFHTMQIFSVDLNHEYRHKPIPTICIELFY